MPNHRAEALCLNLFHTRWGWVGLVASRRGVCAVELPTASRQKTLVRLERRFPGAREVREKVLPKLEEQLKQYFAGIPTAFDIPLDLSALTHFQQQVLRAAVHIPYGAVRSYGWIAARIRKPRASRAVGGAMARNPIPVVIPCHRVIRSDGRLGGFSALEGVALKKKLLALEGIGACREPRGRTVGEGRVQAKTAGNAQPGQH